jgi:formylmethanofuran dehydrogenase subunit E
MDDKNAMWERAVRFHGHICPGLMIGFRASLYAMELLDLEFSEDEETVCIVENDSCSVDAIQAVLGCTVGKGNLLFHMRGKQAFSFYNRNTGKSVRLVQKNSKFERTREEAFLFYSSCSNEEMFDVKETAIELPEEAKIFESYACECCGEKTGANWIRILDGKKVCLDCRKDYDRLNI